MQHDQHTPPGGGTPMNPINPTSGRPVQQAPAQGAFAPRNNQDAAALAHQQRDAAIAAATARPSSKPTGAGALPEGYSLPPPPMVRQNQAAGAAPNLAASAHTASPIPSLSVPIAPANTARPNALEGGTPPGPAPLPTTPVAPMAPPNQAPAIPGQIVPEAPKTATPPPKSNPNSTQNALEIAEVRDGIVIMNDGSYRAVVMARSINFDLMSPQEREGVEYGYQGFLNSLYFTTQIIMRSRKVDMRPYLEKLNKVRQEQDNMLLAMLMEDYIYYISQLVEQTNIMNKQFYVVVPYYTEVSSKQALGETKSLFDGLFGRKKSQLLIDEDHLTKAKTELQNRVQSVMNGLIQLGVQAAPLDTQELIELFYDVYNPDTATREPLGAFNNLSTIVVGKGEGEAPQPHLDQGIF